MAIFNSFRVDFPIFSPLPEAWYLQPLRRGGQVLVQALNLKTFTKAQREMGENREFTRQKYGDS